MTEYLPGKLSMRPMSSSETSRRAGPASGLFDLAREELINQSAWLTVDEAQEELGQDYQIHRLLGKGGMGMVFLGTHRKTNDKVAVKVLGLDVWDDSKFAQRFQREIRIAQRLDHPCVVATKDVGKTALGRYFYTMEVMAGEDLARTMRRRRLCETETMSILERVCAGISYAHKQGIIHRDLKPSNILTNAQGDVKVADFGLAFLVDEHETRLTSTGMAMGTLEYSSPEQLSSKELSEASDVYSLGVIAYEMLTGQVPRGAFKPPSTLCASVDPVFDKVILRTLCPQPSDRFQKVADFLEELRHAHETALLVGTEAILGASQAKVIENFYAEAMAEVPDSVRHFVEDSLLTASGYRESRILDDTAETAGISTADLQHLVDRRLLRLEKIPGGQRVEISHERLTGVIQASRDARHQREHLKAIKAKEAALRCRFRRQLGWTFVAFIVAVGLVWGVKRDQDAKREARSKNLAKQSARNLLNLATNKWIEQLMPLGRLDILEDAHETIRQNLNSEVMDENDAETRGLKLRLLNASAEVAFAKGDTQKAQRLLSDALEIADTIEPQDARFKAIWLAGQVFVEIGEIAQAINLLESALDELSLSIRAEWKPWNGRLRYILAQALQAERRWAAALQTAVAGASHLPQRPDQVADRAQHADWANCMALAGELASQDKDHDNARRFFDRARERLEWLIYEDRDDYRWHLDLIRCLHKEARSYHRSEDIESMKRVIADAVERTQAMIERDPENLLWEHAHATTLVWLGMAAPIIDQEQHARFTEGRNRLERLVARDPGMKRWRWDLIATLQQLAEYFSVRGNPTLASEAMNRALDQFDFLIQQGMNSDQLYGLTVLLQNAGRIYAADENVSVIDFWKRWQRRAADEAGYQRQSVWSFTGMCSSIKVARELALQGDHDGSLAELERAITNGLVFFEACESSTAPSPNWSWRKPLIGIVDEMLEHVVTHKPDLAARCHVLVNRMDDLLFRAAARHFPPPTDDLECLKESKFFNRKTPRATIGDALLHRRAESPRNP